MENDSVGDTYSLLPILTPSPSCIMSSGTSFARELDFSSGLSCRLQWLWSHSISIYLHFPLKQTSYQMFKYAIKQLRSNLVHKTSRIRERPHPKRYDVDEP